MKRNIHKEVVAELKEFSTAYKTNEKTPLTLFLLSMFSTLGHVIFLCVQMVCEKIEAAQIKTKIDEDCFCSGELYRNFLFENLQLSKELGEKSARLQILEEQLKEKK